MGSATSSRQRDRTDVIPRRPFDPSEAVIVAVGLYIGWTVLTWLLEGRIRTFMRPEATLDRLVYTGITNLLVGTILALVLLGWIVRDSNLSPSRFGLRTAGRSVTGILVAAIVGLGLYLAQGAPSTDPTIVGNAFAQVLPVSIAEVLVCWILVGGVLEAWLRHWEIARTWAILVAIVVSSGLFGAYHLAHSPPFNSLAMVGLLTLVGIGTGVFVFVGRSLYGALVFHNFMALYGVTTALVTGGGLETYREPVVSLILTAVVALAVLVVAERRFVRRASMNPSGSLG